MIEGQMSSDALTEPENVIRESKYYIPKGPSLLKRQRDLINSQFNCDIITLFNTLEQRFGHISMEERQQYERISIFLYYAQPKLSLMSKSQLEQFSERCGWFVSRSQSIQQTIRSLNMTGEWALPVVDGIDERLLMVNDGNNSYEDLINNGCANSKRSDIALWKQSQLNGDIHWQIIVDLADKTNNEDKILYAIYTITQLILLELDSNKTIKLYRLKIHIYLEVLMDKIERPEDTKIQACCECRVF